MFGIKRALCIAHSRSLTTVGLASSSNRRITDAKPSPQAGSQSKTEVPKPGDAVAHKGATPGIKKPKKKTMVELDEELRQKMSGIAGDGGTAGIEYEDGKPVALKRGVRNNMFRYI